MPQRLRRLDKLGECILTFVSIGDKGPEIRNVAGKLEPSSSIDLFGYRFRFKEGEREANIGMIFPQGAISQHGESGTNRVYKENEKLVLELAVKKCPGQGGCCQPWSNYVRYFDEH